MSAGYFHPVLKTSDQIRIRSERFLELVQAVDEEAESMIFEYFGLLESPVEEGPDQTKKALLHRASGFPKEEGGEDQPFFARPFPQFLFCLGVVTDELHQCRLPRT